ncbi:MAG: 4-(cytidine 5'-diphospho)-2-C-methyl-D-erythritol kinase [Agathobacter sp.]|nr:4-(cytidine 5'-diphospho)-2-C-methyl-D-erythritol kinase [Agathobacter sp.]
MKEITLKALAKINLGLDVIGKREDGYHELRMVMQTIHLHDRLQIRRTSEPGIKIHTNLSFLPVNESNLVYQAASLLMTEFKITEGVEVNLSKRIPVSAGMAGGSTDAAAMLYGMNRLFELGLSRGELMERGLKLGADIPYCLMRGTALAEGIGEELTQLPPMVKGPVLIAKPAVSVPTKLVYQKLKLDKGMSHPDIDSLVRAIQKKDFDGVCAHMGNVLETVTIPMYPVIEQIKEQMLNSGAAAAMMSGSGPTVFGLFRDEKSAVQAVNEMRSSNLARQVFLTGIYNNRRE